MNKDWDTLSASDNLLHSILMRKQMLPNKSNFVFTFEILGIILGGFEGYVIALTFTSSSFDLGLLAGNVFFVLLFGMFYGNMYVILAGMPIGYCAGYLLKRKKLGLEIGLISGMIILTPILLWNHLEDMYLISYICMVVGIFAGKVIGTKLGLFFNENNNEADMENKN